MAIIREISDIHCGEVSVYTDLTNKQLKSRRHPEQAVIICESLPVIESAIDAGCVPVSFLMRREYIDGKCREILNRFPDIAVYTGEDSMLEQLTGYNIHRGILCAMHRPQEKTADEILASANHIAVLENIVDATNLGAILRSAAALGIDGVLLTPSCADLLSRRAIRVSMGTVFKIPWARIGGSSADWPETGIHQLKSAGFSTLAMALDERAISIEDPAIHKEEKLAIILGTEGSGLLNATIQMSDHTVIIPMAHGVDSLNVGAAATVAFWALRN